MELGEIFGYIISAGAGGGIMSIINWRINKRKATAEVKSDEIENLHKQIEGVYEPLITQLKARVAEQDNEIASLRTQLADERRDRQREIDIMNKRILAITAALGMNAKNQIRDNRGRYKKSIPSEDEL